MPPAPPAGISGSSGNTDSVLRETPEVLAEILISDLRKFRNLGAVCGPVISDELHSREVRHNKQRPGTSGNSGKRFTHFPETAEISSRRTDFKQAQPQNTGDSGREAHLGLTIRKCPTGRFDMRSIYVVSGISRKELPTVNPGFPETAEIAC